MAKSKKIDVLSLVIFGVMVLAIVMAIVGVCIDYTASTSKYLSSSSTLAQLGELNSYLTVDGYGAMAAFAYITLVLSIVTAIVFVVSKFIDVKVMKWVVLAVSALLILSAIIALIIAFTFCSTYKDSIAPAAGPWLLAVFSILSGAAGVFAALKK